MENKTQIICFIAPIKFAKLLGNTLPEKIGFMADEAYLSNGDQLAYVAENGKTEIQGFSEALSKEASIILVPDTFKLLYSPTVSFRIVSHNETPQAKITYYKSLPLYAGHETSIEEEHKEGKETIYKQIADLIKEYYVNI